MKRGARVNVHDAKSHRRCSPGKSKVQAVGKGDPLPSLRTTLSVTVQLVRQDAATITCWTTYTTMRANTAVPFNAKGP